MLHVAARCGRWLGTCLGLGLVLCALYAINTTESPAVLYVAPREGIADQAYYKSSLCTETFNETFADNLEVMKNYPRGVADDYLWKIGGNMTTPENEKRFPVFVTAFDKKFYPQSQGLFRSLHTMILFNPKYAKDAHIIVYDLGMSTRQLNVLKAKCRCEIRTFPFEQFPSHVRVLRLYAFKPIIVQMLLMEFGFVWWLDSSVRVVTPNIDRALTYAVNNSVLFTVTTSSLEDFSLAKQTDVRTFQYLGEDVCKYRAFGEVWATTVLFHYDDVTKYVVRAWVACALNKDCIAPSGVETKLYCHVEDTRDGRCHRFDQSVLGIILYRLYHEHNIYPTDSSLNQIYEIKRGHLVNYFESCKIIALCM